MWPDLSSLLYRGDSCCRMLFCFSHKYKHCVNTGRSAEWPLCYDLLKNQTALQSVLLMILGTCLYLVDTFWLKFRNCTDVVEDESRVCLKLIEEKKWSLYKEVAEMKSHAETFWDSVLGNLFSSHISLWAACRHCQKFHFHSNQQTRNW